MSKARVVVLVLTLLVCFGSEGQEPKPNHYKFWKVKPVEFSAFTSVISQMGLYWAVMNRIPNQ